MSTACFHFYVESKNRTNRDYNKKEAGSQIQRQTRGYPWGEGVGEGQHSNKGFREKNTRCKLNCKNCTGNTDNTV